MIRIAIDGPGGAGKSSVAKEVAARLGIIYVDTGALYRSIGLYMVNRGISPKDAPAVIAALPDLTLELKFLDGKQIILLNGEDVGTKIRTPEISMAASAVSAIPEVREYLLNAQRDIAKYNSVIMDGRDIGTVILPDAEVKIFLTATPEARAERRHKENLERGIQSSYEQVLAEMNERDKNDSTRAVAPCVQAKDATLLDNSKITREQTVEKVIKIIKKRQKKKTTYMKLHKLLAPLFRFFCRLKVHGLENIPKEGGYLICSNHIAAVDPIYIAAVLKRQIYFIAKKEVLSIPVIGWLVKVLGAISLDRGGNDVGAIKAAVELAKKGELVAIFPQGHRYPGVNPATTPKKNGAALIAYHAGCGVIPVCIKVKKFKYALFRRVDIIIGKPIEYSELLFTDGGYDEYRRVTDKVFDEVVSLGGYAQPLPAPEIEGENN